MFSELPLKLLLSILIGAAVGLERESGIKGGQTITAGIRTFSLTCLLGALAGIFYAREVTTISIFIIAAFLLLLVASYIMSSIFTRETGLTSEISFVYIFLIGFLLTTELLPLHLIVALFAVLMLVLAFKAKAQQLLGGVSRHEIESFISYAIIALVVLPFLPNIAYRLGDISFIQTVIPNLGEYATLELINPRKIWFIVVLVTGVDVIGYILSRLFGSKRGFALTSFVAGFISSTSATQSLAQKSKTEPSPHYLVGAAILANLASFFQIFLLLGPLNGAFLVSIIPILIAIILSSSILSWWFFKHSKTQQSSEGTDASKQQIFSLMPAIKFGVLIIFVQLITKLCLIAFGESGFVVSSVIASFAGLDAIIINLANLAGTTITFKLAIATFILVNATNLISKSIYAFIQGTKSFSRPFFVSVLIIILSSVVGLLMI